MNLDYKNLRNIDFQHITNALEPFTSHQTEEAIVACGDSTELLKLIPSESVSLILTDPPYHTTKKKNITNDTAFDSDDDFLSWMKELMLEFRRILKPNGSIYLFCSSKMSARLEILYSEYFNVLSQIVWSKPNEPGFDGWKQKMKKESLRQWYAHSERIIFAEPAFEGNLFRVWFANALRENRQLSGMSMKDLTELTGDYGTVNHGGAVSNWEAGRNVPSREQYEKICKGLLSTGRLTSMPFYEDLIRPFDVNSDVEFIDVWAFYSVRPYSGKHPAEKPLDMLDHCIKSSTYEGDIILDCFAGSGSTAISALNNNRKTISIEIDENWSAAIVNRLSKYKNESSTLNGVKSTQSIMRHTGTKTKNAIKTNDKMPTLF
jgi:site-specific DNA-methyltransferase (adenine-specific)